VFLPALRPLWYRRPRPSALLATRRLQLPAPRRLKRGCSPKRLTASVATEGLPINSLPVATAEPEAVTVVTAEETPPRPTAPDLCVPLTVCVDEAPPLVASGVPPDDVRQLPAVDDPPEPATIVEVPERDTLLMVAPSASDYPPTPPEPSTGMDDQKTSPMEELAHGFTAVTLVMVDKPPDELLERPKTPRAFADENRECYYVTTDYGSSEDERNGARPPEHDIPRDTQRDSAATFVASPLTCDDLSLCIKSRRKANETFVQTISTGVPGRDLD
jgi:hypothetical protein